MWGSEGSKKILTFLARASKYSGDKWISKGMRRGDQGFNFRTKGMSKEHLNLNLKGNIWN